MILKPIPGYSDYFASDEGNIYSKRRGALKRLEKDINRGRWTVCIRHNSQIKAKRTKVARLVALAWHVNTNEYPLVMHKDNNPLNDVPDNLMWGTSKMNNQQAVKDGTHKSGIQKYKPNLRYRAKKLHDKGVHFRVIATRLGIKNPSYVHKLIKKAL